MSKRVLITGGAGFIGSHLADELLSSGYKVRVLDNLSEQVHPSRRRPDYLDPDVELQVGDVRDPAAVANALRDVDAVFHMAAMVGASQSMSRIDDYVSGNDMGTAVLLQMLIERPVERLIVASSMSIYGEGLYYTPSGNVVEDANRSLERIKAGEWELTDANGGILQPAPTPETKRPNMTSVYALSKYAQERMCMIVGQAHAIPTVALRFFNVYGTRQALSNPYAGALTTFASCLINGNAPAIFEDGRQQRDFVHVRDAANACRLALETPAAAGQVFNVGSGQPRTIAELASRLAHAVGKPHIIPDITDRFRVGDIRHCFADLTRTHKVLGYRPCVPLEEGLAEMAAWLETKAAIDQLGEVNQGMTA